MKSAAVMFPILPGKSEQARAFAEAVQSRREEFGHAMGERGLIREDWYIQTTPQGEAILVVMEGEDPLKALNEWAVSQEAFDVWFKTQACEVSGVDFNQPMPGLPEHVFAWNKA